MSYLQCFDKNISYVRILKQVTIVKLYFYSCCLLLKSTIYMGNMAIRGNFIIANQISTLVKIKNNLTNQLFN